MKNTMNYYEKIQKDMVILQSRIDDCLDLRAEYKSFVEALPYRDQIIEKKDINKTIWICWFQGIENAPELVQKCVKNNIRKLNDYEKIILTSDNFSQYVNVKPLILEKWKKGIISNTAFSNILRLEILIKYGGIWMDSTVLFTGESFPKYVTNYPIFMFSSWKWITGDIRPISTWFIAAQKEHPFLKAVLDCLYKYWTDKNELVTYFIFHMFFSFVMERYPIMYSQFTRISNVPPHYMQFELQNKFSKLRFKELTDMSSIHKLSYKLDKEIFDDKENLYNYLIRNYL